jgi:hypothetical protein
MAYYMQLPALSEVVPADILHDKRFAQFAPYSASPLVSCECFYRVLEHLLTLPRSKKSQSRQPGLRTVFPRQEVPTLQAAARPLSHPRHRPCTPTCPTTLKEQSGSLPLQAHPRVHTTQPMPPPLVVLRILYGCRPT